MPTNNKYDLVAQNPHSTVVAEYTPEYGAREKRTEQYQSEAELEQAFIEQLELQAYGYLAVTSEEGLKQNLRKQLEKLNDYTFSDSEWEDLPKHIVGQNWEELPNSKDPDEAWKEYKK